MVCGKPLDVEGDFFVDFIDILNTLILAELKELFKNIKNGVIKNTRNGMKMLKILIKIEQ